MLPVVVDFDFVAVTFVDCYVAFVTLRWRCLIALLFWFTERLRLQLRYTFVAFTLLRCWVILLPVRLIVVTLEFVVVVVTHVVALRVTRVALPRWATHICWDAALLHGYTFTV